MRQQTKWIAAFVLFACPPVVDAGELLSLRVHSCVRGKNVISESLTIEPASEQHLLVPEFLKLPDFRKVVRIEYRVDLAGKGYVLRARALRGPNDERVEVLPDTPLVIQTPLTIYLKGDAGEPVSITFESWRYGDSPKLFGGTYKCPDAK